MEQQLGIMDRLVHGEGGAPGWIQSASSSAAPTHDAWDGKLPVIEPIKVTALIDGEQSDMGSYDMATDVPVYI